MTIEYSINKESNEQFTLKLLDDKDCDVVLEYVRRLTSTEMETWTSKRKAYIVYDHRPSFGKYEYNGIFRTSNKMIDFHVYLIQKRIDNINKLEGCLQLEYTTEGVN